MKIFNRYLYFLTKNLILRVLFCKFAPNLIFRNYIFLISITKILKIMKKIARFAFALVALAVTACAPSAEKIAEKINAGEELSPKEMTQALDMSADAVSVVNDSLAACKGDFAKMIEFLKNYDAQNPDINVILQRVLTSDPSTLSEADRKVYDRLMKNVETMTQTVTSAGPAALAVPIHDGGDEEGSLSGNAADKPKVIETDSVSAN